MQATDEVIGICFDRWTCLRELLAADADAAMPADAGTECSASRR
jgi:hypothetical protein